MQRSSDAQLHDDSPVARPVAGIRGATASRSKRALPVAARLWEALEARPDTMAATLCTTSRGTSWTVDGFKTSLFKFIRALERDGVIANGLTFHGLRHKVATDLRELGFDARTIADMLGQRSESMAMHYSRDADLQNKLKPAVENWKMRRKHEQKCLENLGKVSRRPRGERKRIALLN